VTTAPQVAPAAALAAPPDPGGRAAYVFETLPDFRTPVTGGRAEYVIDPRPGGWTCTCPAFGFAPADRKTCTHLAALRASLAAQATADLAEAIANETATILERCETALGQLAARSATDPIRQAWRRAAAAEHGARRTARPVSGTPGALEQWRRELAAGTRTTTTFDALWRRACDEAGGSR
jgi:hypothetical protein